MTWFSRIVFYICATLIIVAALFVSVFQLLTPFLNDHRVDFERMASSWLHMPVKIERVSVAWHQYYPLVNFKGVQLYHPTTNIPLLTVKQVSAFLSIPSTIWQHRPVVNRLLIKGAAIDVYQNEKGEFILKGFPALQTMQSSETPIDDVMNAFSNQPKLTLQAIDVLYTSKAKHQYAVTVNELQIANNDNEHVFTAKAVLRQAIPTDLTVQADWEGAVFNIKQITGHLYVEANGLSLGQWARGYTYLGFTLPRGIISTRNWVTLEKGGLQQFQSQIQLYDGLLSSGKKSIALNRFSGEIGIHRDKETWVIAAKDILIDTPTFVWPTTGLYAVIAKNQQGDWVPNQLSIAYLSLDESMKWLPFIPSNIIQPFEKTLTGLNPRGDLHDLKLTFQEEGGKQSLDTVAMRFSNLSLKAIDPYPGILHFAGTLAGSKNTGKLVIATTKGRFDYPFYFSNPMTFDQITAEVNWQKQLDTNELKINAKEFHLANRAITLSGAGDLVIPDAGSSVIDLTANFSLAKIEKITDYLPDKVLEKGVNEWVAQAFLKGSGQAGKIKIQGKLNEFPFDNEGDFLVSTDVNNIDFRYAPEWPIIRSVNGTVTFSGRKILVDVQNGKIDQFDIGKVSAVIPYLGDSKPAIVEVATQPIDLDLSVGIGFLMQTPLKNTYAHILQALHPAGPARLQLQLTVPLRTPENTAIKGALSIKGSQLNMQDWGLRIDRLNGALTFTENDITADKLVGDIFKQPIMLSLKTARINNKRSRVDASFVTHLKMDDLEKWLKLKPSPFVTGESDVSGVVHLSIAEPLSVDLASNLLGVIIDATPPYQKTGDEKKQFRAALFATDKNGLRFRFNYDQLLSGAMILNENKKQFSVNALTLMLGSGEPAWPTQSGLSIVGYLDQIKWDQWQSYLKGDSNANTNGGYGSPISLPLKHIDIKTAALSIFNQQIKNLRLEVEFYPNYWDVDLTSPQVTGHIKIPTHFSRDEIISVQLDSLSLSAADSGGSNEQLADWNLQTMPAVIFYANRMKYNQLDLGRLSFKTETLNNGVAIHDLLITSNNLKLNGSGWWKKSGAHYATELSGSADSDNVSALLQSFGFDVHNYVLKNGQFKYDLSWNKPPFAPEFKSMTGTASLKIGKGRILEVKETSGAKMDIGRMLSIFSLQTIPRRLSLDFSDLFQSGYSFDIFQGDFSFKYGSLYTGNTFFEGPVARIGITGNIGLIGKDYDLTLSVTPHVTSSIPVAATLLVNPVIGVAAFAANKVLAPAISQATTYYYNVQGPWDNPTWKSVKSVKSR